MAENLKPEEPTEPQEDREMLVNEYGATRDSAVVIEEKDRTVLLTENETLTIEKDKTFDVVPINRPRKVYAGMWGNPEIVTVGLALFPILAVLVIYFFFVLPAQRNLETKQAESRNLEEEVVKEEKKYGAFTDTKTQVAKIVESVDRFERNLPIVANGQVALYQRLNALIAAYGLVNTNGPDYAPLETTDTQRRQQTESESGRSKYRSFFPGVYVTTTVEGSYQNLRQFIREVENSSQFVMISAVELEPAESPEVREQPQTNPSQTTVNNFGGNPTVGSPPQTVTPEPAAQRGKTHGETVALRIEMVAYFSRPNVQTPTVTNQ